MRESYELDPPEIAAKKFYQAGVSLLTYRALQIERKGRIKTFEKHKIPFLVDEAKKLHEYGKQVYAIMEKYYAKEIQ